MQLAKSNSTFLAKLLILKFDKSKDFKDLHPQNIPPISVASDTLKFDKFNDIKEVILRKMLPASFNFTTPKSFIFNEVIDVQLKNI